MSIIFYKNPIFYVKLPKAGLANKLLVWAHALAFTKKLNVPFYMYGWFDFHIGPFLRREKKKRLYLNYFKSKSILTFPELLLLRLLKKSISFSDNLAPTPNSFILYDKFPHWSDYFSDIRLIRPMIIDEFNKMIHPKLLPKINTFQNNCIGVHIRMGDFRPLKDQEDFSKTGMVRTPLPYFTDSILKLRKVAGKNLKAVIFSDGHKPELEEILQLDNVHLAEPNPDIIDLISLSKCKVIITSAGSTFSYWAVFISDSAAVIHPQHPISIRGNGFYEKYIDENDIEFANYLKSMDEK